MCWSPATQPHPERARPRRGAAYLRTRRKGLGRLTLHQLDEFGCDCTLRFARRYRDAVAPRATALEHRLGQKGGFCDCEIFLNGWTLRYEHQLFDPDSEEYEYPEELPACRGVRAGSIQPCELWMVRPRGLW